MAFQKGHPCYVKRESYEKLSKRFTGQGNPFFGKKHNAVTKQKMIESKKIKPIWCKGLKGKMPLEWYEKSNSVEARQKRFIKSFKYGCREMYHQRARRIMEKYLGRKLTSREIIHHLDFNYKNNDIDNLYLFNTTSEHTQYHHFLTKLVKKHLVK